MNTCLLVNLDLIASINSYAWIIHKSNPNVPLIKLTNDEFELIKNGIYKHYHNPMFFNGKKYWISDHLNDRIKSIAKMKEFNLGDMAISMQEYLNPDIIENLTININNDNLKLIENNTDNIIFYTERFLNKIHDNIIKRIFEELEKKNVLSKTLIYLNKNLSNIKESDVAYKKVVKLLELMFGYDLTLNSGFKNELERKYNIIKVYDNNDDSFSQLRDIQLYFDSFMEKTDNETIKQNILNYIMDMKPYVDLNTVTTNKFNKVSVKTIILEQPLIVKTFESFRFNNKLKMIKESIGVNKIGITAEEVFPMIDYADAYKDLYPNYNEDSEFNDEYYFQSKEEAYKNVNDILDFFNNLDEPIPLYRTIKVDDISKVDYSNLGESWSYDKDSALNFGSHIKANVLLTAFTTFDNVDWKQTIKVHYLFSDTIDADAENEISINDSDLLTDVKAVYIKNLK